MKCPHCLTSFHDAKSVIQLGNDADGDWHIQTRSCPECKRMVIHLIRNGFSKVTNGRKEWIAEYEQLVHPRSANRPPPSPDVLAKYADDYKEACLVLADSPKASAALSRRCLQHLLREEAKVKPGNLADEIQQVVDSGKLPSYVVESIDAVRNIGNFAAHPMKSKATGEVLPVEPGEAEWNLDVLELLFDFYFVHPKVREKKREALNQKLVQAGKPPMK